MTKRLCCEAFHWTEQSRRRVAGVARRAGFSVAIKTTWSNEDDGDDDDNLDDDDDDDIYVWL